MSSQCWSSLNITRLVHEIIVVCSIATDSTCCSDFYPLKITHWRYYNIIHCGESRSSVWNSVVCKQGFFCSLKGVLFRYASAWTRDNVHSFLHMHALLGNVFLTFVLHNFKLFICKTNGLFVSGVKRVSVIPQYSLVVSNIFLPFPVTSGVLPDRGRRSSISNWLRACRLRNRFSAQRIFSAHHAGISRTYYLR